MTSFALKDTAGSVIRYQDFTEAPPILAPEKGFAWVREDPPIPVPSPATIPNIVPMAKARIALYRAGLLAAVTTALANLTGPEGEEARIIWEYETMVHRESQLIRSLAPALGLTNQQVDNLFMAASLL